MSKLSNIYGLIMGDRKWHYFSVLWPILSADEADEMGKCDNCRWAYRCHPIRISDGAKFCTLDFRDAYMPGLKFEQMV